MKSILPCPLLLSLAAGGCAAGGDAARVSRPAHTYSIVARDKVTGDLGVAVQSHYFSVGAMVPWAEAGVGAVATQSFVDPSYGPKGLQLMKSGVAAPEALARLVKADAGEAVRQVAMVDASGRVAAHTGSKCIEAAEHRMGEGYSVQANMMLNSSVVPAMARAYESARGDLADRLVAALEAAQAAGGDIRGQQSSALLVVKAKPSGAPWKDTLVSLRVEDHREPVRELRRLLQAKRAYQRLEAGDAALDKGDLKRSLEEYAAAAELLPGNPEPLYWAALGLATRGHMEEARPMFRRVFKQDANWRELTRRLPRAGIIPDDENGRKLLEEILKVES